MARRECGKADEPLVNGKVQPSVCVSDLTEKEIALIDGLYVEKNVAADKLPYTDQLLGIIDRFRDSNLARGVFLRYGISLEPAVPRNAEEEALVLAMRVQQWSVFKLFLDLRKADELTSLVHKGKDEDSQNARRRGRKRRKGNGSELFG